MSPVGFWKMVWPNRFLRTWWRYIRGYLIRRKFRKRFWSCLPVGINVLTTISFQGFISRPLVQVSNSLITYMTKMFDKWCFGSINTSVKSSRPILTSLTVAWYCKIPELVTLSSDWVDVLEIVNSESTSISRGNSHVNCSWGLLFSDISSNTTISVSRFRRDWVVFK